MKDEGVSGFPCLYTFKVFGRHSETFGDQVSSVVATTVGTLALDSVKVRRSEHGNYVCVSIVTRLASREELEQIYRDLGNQVEVILYL
jgi:putative lipoic acid-binding regulatory protein